MDATPVAKTEAEKPIEQPVNPPDAAKPDLSLTEPEEDKTKKRGRPKGTSSRTSKNALAQIEGEKLLDVLERIATSLETLASKG